MVLLRFLRYDSFVVVVDVDDDVFDVLFDRKLVILSFIPVISLSF